MREANPAIPTPAARGRSGAGGVDSGGLAVAMALGTHITIELRAKTYMQAEPHRT